MRSKSPLALMEQLVMVLVFALAAALCLQVFVFSDRASSRNEAVDRAVLRCQSAAETMKAAGGGVDHAQHSAMAQMGGTVSQGLWQVLYDEDWNTVSSGDAWTYRLEVQETPAPVEGLCQAEIWVTAQGEDAPLFSLTVAWQEVDGNGS